MSVHPATVDGYQLSVRAHSTIVEPRQQTIWMSLSDSWVPNDGVTRHSLFIECTGLAGLDALTLS